MAISARAQRMEDGNGHSPMLTPCRNARFKIAPKPVAAAVLTAGRQAKSNPNSELPRLEAALLAVAELLIREPVYADIFRRLEEEIAIEKTLQSDDVLDRARAIVRQKAIGVSKR